MSSAATAQQLALHHQQITEWAQSVFGLSCTVRNVGSLGGHSGVTIGFDVYDAEHLIERLVLKTPPPGVARKNNFDVLRQVPLLQVLEANEIPAPRIRWWSDDEQAFGAPYLIMSRLAGGSPPDLFRDPATVDAEHAARMFEQAIDVLVDIHAIDTNKHLADWEATRAVEAEIEHWVGIVQKSSDQTWIKRALEVHDLLRATKPSSIFQGLTHGDYYSNNWVFDEYRLSGVVDWEGTSIGPSLLDLGWLYMMYEPESWGSSRHASMAWQPDPQSLVNRYALRSSRDLSDLVWYRALAGYRLACISAYYYEEHISGRRINKAWEMFHEAYPAMLGRAYKLLSG